MQLLFIFSLLLSITVTSLAAPATYDQRQDGKVNVHAKLENFLIVVAPSSGSDSSSGTSGIDFIVPGVLDAFEFRKNLIGKEDTIKNMKKNLEEINEESGNDEIQLLKDTKDFESDKFQNKVIEHNTESRLIGGGIENCGPGRFRDSYGICQSESSLKL